MSTTPLPSLTASDRLTQPKFSSRFIEAQLPVTRHQIESTRREVARRLTEWAADYPSMRTVRIKPLCLTLAAASPYCTPDQLFDVARVNLWIFALDDSFDEHLRTDAQLAAATAHYADILRHEETQSIADDPLADALLSIRHGLEKYAVYEALRPTWATAFGQMMTGMLQENRWRARYRESGRLPTYEAYCQCGRFTVGGPPHIWATLISLDDPSTITHLQWLTALEERASLCIRLANDLQSYAKERQEGNINSIVIQTWHYLAQGLPDDVAQNRARQFVLDHMGDCLQELFDRRSFSRTRSRLPEQSIINIAAFVSEFYGGYDFHTFNTLVGEAQVS